MTYHSSSMKFPCRILSFAATAMGGSVRTHWSGWRPKKWILSSAIPNLAVMTVSFNWVGSFSQVFLLRHVPDAQQRHQENAKGRRQRVEAAHAVIERTSLIDGTVLCQFSVPVARTPPQCTASYQILTPLHGYMWDASWYLKWRFLKLIGITSWVDGWIFSPASMDADSQPVTYANLL